MSIFTRKLPEGWALGSIVMVAIQIAAIIPAIYTIVDRFTNKISIPRGKFIQTSLIICTLCNIPLALFWDKTIWLFGSQHSITLIVLGFVLGMFNICSEIVFMPFMANFRPVYLPAYFIGAGLSAMVPSFVAMIQGTLQYECVRNVTTQELEPQFKEPRFGAEIFYVIMFAWMCLATISFYLINMHADKLEQLCGRKEFTEIETEELEKENEDNGLVEKKKDVWYDTLLLGLMSLLGFELYTLVPNLQSYAALPYSQTVYFWSLILASVAQPVGALVSFFIHLKSIASVVILSVICSGCSLIFLIISLQSPNPMFKDHWFGGTFVIVIQVALFIFGYMLRTALLELYRDAGANEKKEFRLFVGGLTTQASVLSTTLIMFLLINVARVFKDAPMC
ncbi:Riboflavin transporter [Aphelenchoides bicaudatus]|nr:Riboflavin transporter [Aphelenchoides bicaudatus]